MHPGGDGALLHEAGVVHDQHAVRVPEPLGHVFLQVIADLVRFPLAPRQQSLQAVRGDMARMLGQLPAVLPAHRPQQPAHVVPHVPTRLNPPEALAHPQQQRPQLGIPQTYFDIALRLHNRFNAPRSGESRTTATLTWRQQTRLQKSHLTRTYGEVQLEY